MCGTLLTGMLSLVISEHLPDMETKLGGLVQPELMEKFREGTFDDSSTVVQETWKMVMLNFLPRICKAWGKSVQTVLLSDCKEATIEMEALVCWYIDMHGASRWEPEHREDENKRVGGATIEPRQKRAGDQEKEKRKQGPILFAKYVKLVRERRGDSRDWDRALKEAAEKAISEDAQPTGETEGNGGPRKRQRKKAPEPVIPVRYQFNEDGTAVPLAEV